MNKKLKIGVTIIAIFVSILLGTKVYATTGTTINNTTRLRKKASTNSDVVELISKNEKVEIDSEDGDWYKVNYKSSDGKVLTGYVRKDLLNVEKVAQEESTTESETNSEEQTQEANQNQENTLGTNEPEEQNEIQTDITEKQEIELKNDMEVQLLPLVFSSKTGKINKNTKVTVTEVVGNWCHIESDSQEGWIMTSKIEVSQNSTEESKTENKKEEEKQEENKKEDKASAAKGTKLYVSTSTLNLREKADTSSRILEQLEQNDEVTVVETVDNKWSKVTINGVTGYVSTQYLSKEKSKEVSSRSSEDRKESQKENKDNTNNTTNTTTENTTNKTKESNTNNNTNSSKETTKKETVESTQKSEEKIENTENSKSTSKVTGSDVVAYAKKFLGYKYVYGTAGPNTFDCSGFTSYVYKHFGYTLKRTSTDQRSNGTAVNKSNLQAGDIVCFSGHVGIYVGDGKFIHAANSQKGVIISSLSESYYAKKYITARRILN